MKDDESTLEKIEHVPSEFADFVREAGIRAFDALAKRLLSKQSGAPTRLQALADTWSGLDHDEKRDFFGQVIAAASIIGAAAPMLTQMTKSAAKPSAKRKAASKKPASGSKSSASTGSKASKEASSKDSKGKKEKKEKKDKKEKKGKKEKKEKKEK